MGQARFGLSDRSGRGRPSTWWLLVAVILPGGRGASRPLLVSVAGDVARVRSDAFTAATLECAATRSPTRQAWAFCRKCSKTGQSVSGRSRLGPLAESDRRRARHAWRRGQRIRVSQLGSSGTDVLHPAPRRRGVLCVSAGRTPSCASLSWQRAPSESGDELPAGVVAQPAESGRSRVLVPSVTFT